VFLIKGKIPKKVKKKVVKEPRAKKRTGAKVKIVTMLDTSVWRLC
jgi:hypothetical protein